MLICIQFNCTFTICLFCNSWSGCPVVLKIWRYFTISSIHLSCHRVWGSVHPGQVGCLSKVDKLPTADCWQMEIYGQFTQHEATVQINSILWWNLIKVSLYLCIVTYLIQLLELHWATEILIQWMHFTHCLLCVLYRFYITLHHIKKIKMYY